MCRYRPPHPSFVACNCKQQKLGMKTWDEAIYGGVSEESFCVHTPISLLWFCLVNELVETYSTTFSISTIAVIVGLTTLFITNRTVHQLTETIPQLAM